MTNTGLELRSLVTAGGDIELSLVEVQVRDPQADEIVIRVEAAPINPSDLALMLGGTSSDALQAGGTREQPILTAPIPDHILSGLKARQGDSMPVGNEGAGVVIAAGASIQHLRGRLVAMFGGAMYAQYRTMKASECLLLPEGATARDGASSFVNPLTALGMVETMRREDHTALVHTAAASNLGQMLNRICLADDVQLVNIVRSAEQAKTLTNAGAKYVLDSTASAFREELADALVATGATLAFDAIGGGTLAGEALAAMEVAANRTAAGYSRYGSTVKKQVYIYGRLDPGPTMLNHRFGMIWGVGGWLLMPFLAKIGTTDSQRLRQRVADELKTTFASHYTAEISLFEALQKDVIDAYARRATGSKYLINPQKPA